MITIDNKTTCACGNAQVGKSYVVFGKINSTAINLSSI
jgi:hypothetical protein